MVQLTSDSMQVVKREEKEVKLTQFILSEIAAGRVTIDAHWSVVALSMKSPVISALHRVVNELEVDELSLNIVLTGGRKLIDVDGFDRVQAFAIRVGQSSRLLDAHEQLVLGEVSSWTGDCMRRDPMERDAFETFGANNRELASWARKSFAHFWSAAKPISASGSRGKAVYAAGVEHAAVGEGAKPTTLVAATSRH